MSWNFVSSAFSAFNTTDSTATGSVSYTQAGSGQPRGAEWILQYSNTAGGPWIEVDRTAVTQISASGTNVPVSFTSVVLPDGHDSEGFFRVVGQASNPSGPSGGLRTTGAVVSGETTVCFLAGTQIATPAGGVAVETLAIGDLVLTADGRAVPVMWLGRQTVSTTFSLSEARRPVLIRAGALGENLPVRDLRVTSDHAMVIDGVLVQAGALINGSSITRMAQADLGDRFTVFHIETENHEIIVAEGAATETFIDNVTRARFDNFAEFVALYGAEGRPMEELAQPRAMSARQVPAAIRAQIAGRAVVLAGVSAIAA
ncbi:Hint domain-containing protein [Humitalea sp. 24SJ18S-53]|uniref:Hint domain-containing protein n=1 Tax=Humitalea sp. 24SJ18S-53 TaxID=3422307 RepID=UPI003D677256